MTKKRSSGAGFWHKFKAIGLGRLLIATVLALVGGWYAFALALSGISRGDNPATALTFTPTDSNALAAQADLLFFANPAKPPEKVYAMARSALRQQAVNPRALRLLGYYADAKGQPSRAMLLNTEAAKLSRRESGAQFWLIEAHARAGDTKKTLEHYDILLRTKPDSQMVLYPRLLGAISDAEIRTALKPYVRSDKAWVSAFLWQAVNSGEDASALVSLIVEAKGFPPGAASRMQEQALLGRLATEKRFDDAQRIFRLIPGATPARLTDASFNETDRDGRYGPLGWKMLDDPDAGGGFTGKQGDKDTSLQLFANSSTTRIIASKLLYLHPGNYHFKAKLASIERGDGGYLRWQLRCADDPANQPAWILEMDAKLADTTLTIPASCPVQYLDIVASGGKAQTGMEAVISNVAISTKEN
jgi:tetratricopeptide (TPR) repeat protein